jgi:hypothetical protein
MHWTKWDHVDVGDVGRFSLLDLCLPRFMICVKLFTTLWCRQTWSAREEISTHSFPARVFSVVSWINIVNKCGVNIVHKYIIVCIYIYIHTYIHQSVVDWSCRHGPQETYLELRFSDISLGIVHRFPFAQTWRRLVNPAFVSICILVSQRTKPPFIMYLPIFSYDLPIFRVIYLAVCQNLVPLVNIKIAGKWMFIPLKMVLIGIDPYQFI